MTFWTDATGRQLDRTELAALRQRARHLYDSNTHIFEDEADALVALGVVAPASSGTPPAGEQAAAVPAAA